LRPGPNFDTYKGYYRVSRVSLKTVALLCIDMDEKYPDDWSDEDIAAASIKTPSWESQTEIDESDKEKLLDILQDSLDRFHGRGEHKRNDQQKITRTGKREHETIFDESKMTVSFDPDV